MKRLGMLTALLFVLIFNAHPAAAETPTFDPDQPFRESLSTHVLRSLLNRALDVLEDHVHIDGSWSNSNATGGPSGRIELKLYPKGKSHSDEHLKAEGWFHSSPDSNLQDFHFRLERPKHSADDRSGTGDVL